MITVLLIAATALALLLTSARNDRRKRQNANTSQQPKERP